MKSCGNRCGHNSNKPKIDLQYKSVKRPSVINSLIWRIKDFYFNPIKIPALMNAFNSKRLRRSESRESIVLVLSCIAKYTNIKAGNNVGWVKSGAFYHLTYKNICNQTGLSLSRVERAMKEIKRAGLVKVIQQNKTNSDGTKSALSAIKYVMNSFFRLMGLSQELEKYKQFIAKEKAKAEKAKAEKDHFDKQIKKHEDYKNQSLSENENAFFDRLAALKQGLKLNLPHNPIT